MMGSENISRGGFPQNVIAQAGIASKIKPASFLSNRSDLRGKTIFAFSEDANSPAECAFSLYRNGGGWQLGVHIVDVSEYVCDGSPLDIEARRRSARINNGFSKSEMLPDIIVNDICNLAKDGDKLAVSVMLDIDNGGNLKSVSFEESVIRITGNCVYGEIDQLGLTRDASAVMALRKKYAAFNDTLIDMYELAALFCIKRRERGGLDCTYFRRVYERDSEGKIISFSRVAEPDSRAMIREIGYFTAEAVGKYMLEHKLPCIFNGRKGVNAETLDYLTNLVGADPNETDPAKRAADIADLAKGRDYYDFVCDLLRHSVPCAEFSVKPIPNSLCACDHIVSFFNPVSHYTDLLIQRALKIAAKAGVPQNLNMNRYIRSLEEACAQANEASRYIDSTLRRYAKLSALQYIKDSGERTFSGMAVKKHDCGEIAVILECGLLAAFPVELTDGYEFKPASYGRFEIVSLGTETEPTLINIVK